MIQRTTIEEIAWGDGYVPLLHKPQPVYEDDLVTIYKNDMRDVMPHIANDSIDHLITDPPYEEQAHTKGRRTYQKLEARSKPGEKVKAAPLSFAPLTEPLREYLVDECLRVARGWSLIFCQAEAVGNYAALFGPAYRRPMIWQKLDGMPQLTGDRPGMGYESIVASWCGEGRSKWNGGGSLGIFTYSKYIEPSEQTNHETQKPERLMRELLDKFTNPGDLILDPFGGSGTTAKACRDMGRRCITIERDDHGKDYIGQAIHRIRKMQPLFMI